MRIVWGAVGLQKDFVVASGKKRYRVLVGQAFRRVLEVCKLKKWETLKSDVYCPVGAGVEVEDRLENGFRPTTTALLDVSGIMSSAVGYLQVLIYMNGPIL